MKNLRVSALFFLTVLVPGLLIALLPGSTIPAVLADGESDRDAELAAAVARLSPNRQRKMPQLPGVPVQAVDLLISEPRERDASEPVVVTNQAELSLILEQMQDVHKLSPAHAAQIQKAYDTALSQAPNQTGSIAIAVNPEKSEDLTDPAAFLTRRLKDSVPILPEGYAEDAIGDEIDPITKNRRDAEGVPNTSLFIRRYAGHVVEKYDLNRDGKLQRNEWEKMPGKPQAYDLNGDLVLENHELLYHLAAYAKDRTISHPVPPRRLSATQKVLKTDGPILIHPLSGPIRKQKPDDEESVDVDKLPSDISPEELATISADADKGAGTEEQPQMFDVVTKETGASATTVREYAPSPSALEGVPRWFLVRDADGDGQLSLREFAPTLSLDSTAFFGKLDANSDGLITPEEVRTYLEKNGLPNE
ncbi:MAG: hypothetical protein ACOX6D_07085 [Thermoguttaceae bacterium]|jgi:hypothetical protein